MTDLLCLLFFACTFFPFFELHGPGITGRFKVVLESSEDPAGIQEHEVKKTKYV